MTDKKPMTATELKMQSEQLAKSMREIRKASAVTIVAANSIDAVEPGAGKAVSQNASLLLGIDEFQPKPTSEFSKLVNEHGRTGAADVDQGEWNKND